MVRYNQLVEGVKAVQWFKQGNHPKVTHIKKYPWFISHTDTCLTCGNPYKIHGYIAGTGYLALLHWQIVCPTDWIVERSDGTIKAIKLEEFDKKYEKVTEDKKSN